MSKETTQDYSSIPRDFPRAHLLNDILSNYQMCEEFLAHVLREVKTEQLRSPLIATPEIVERHFELAKQAGWGCFPGEIEWIFRNAVRELGCEMPGCLIR
jgi:hypothetical protein